MTACKIGRIHSFESFGTQDGPGIRFVVFLQGCFARCVYCHNPDTWSLKVGFTMQAKEVFDKVMKVLPYLDSSGGGITISGGEPLLQQEFLIELFKLCKKASIHTCIDTSCFYNLLKHPRGEAGKPNPVTPRGCSFYGRKVSQLVYLTDLFLVDIKAIDEKLHKKITGRDIDEVLSFIDMLEKRKKPYWLRYVLVPGLNDKKEQIKPLKEFLSKLKYCEKFEFLPYHTLGKHKWHLLGLKYPLQKTLPATANDIKKAYKAIVDK